MAPDAQAQAAEVAKKLSNPVASIISFPIQNNWDFGIGDTNANIGRWIWNRTQTRRDPKTGRRRQFPKPQSEWFVSMDESLRIIPRELWDRVQEHLVGVRKSWPGHA